MMPIPAVAGETGCVEAKHGADLAGAKPGNQLLEARARHGAAGGAAKIVVDDLDIAKSVSSCFINEIILAALALKMDLHLRLCGLAHYTIALRLSTVGDSASAFVIADLLGIRAGGFHQQTRQAPNGGVAVRGGHPFQHGAV